MSYWLVGVILTIIGITNQKNLQLFLGSLRFLAIFGMTVFSFVKIILDCPHSLSCSHYYNSTNLISTRNRAVSVQNTNQIQLLYHFDFFQWLLSIPVYLFTVQNIPLLPSVAFHTKNK
ncbi:hypothetical protein, partial [Salmonella sp. s51228]|uniref:hypothetical protein n=1 Tax=Salmonella sp. s51228 TaxID=3159652 RepID=UPI00397FE3B2